MTKLVYCFRGGPLLNHDIQFVSDPSSDDASPLNGQEVTIQILLLLNFGDQIGLGSCLFKIQKAHGMGWCFNYDGWDQFDWVDAVGNPHPGPGEGDEVTLTGTVEEYFNLTEPLTLRLVLFMENRTRLVPSLITPSEIGEAYEDACKI